MGRGRLEMTMLNKWGTVAFERNFIQRILTNDPHRGVETWLRMVPPAYRADVATWVTETFNRKWAKQKATQETMHALVAEIMRFIEGVEPRDPIPDDGIPWIADPPPWEWRHEEHQRRMVDILATGPVRPLYQHSPATYVEGREAPRPCGHRGLPCECEDRKRAAAREAEMLEACARAAYEAWATHRPSGEPFSDSGDEWREVARAVLAAAGRGGR